SKRNKPLLVKDCYCYQHHSNNTNREEDILAMWTQVKLKTEQDRQFNVSKSNQQFLLYDSLRKKIFLEWKTGVKME
ncbi:hypothetical protein ANN_27681, partial [Periplaneta americana]